MEEIFVFLVIAIIILVAILSYYIQQAKEQSRLINQLTEKIVEQRADIGRLVSLFHNLFFTERLSKTQLSTMAIQFFTEKDLIKYGWEKSGYSINEFYEGEYDDLPEKMFANEEETAKYIMMEDKPEKLGLTRHAFFMKTIPKKLKELNDNFSYNLFSYKIFIKRYTALFLK